MKRQHGWMMAGLLGAALVATRCGEGSTPPTGGDGLCTPACTGDQICNDGTCEDPMTPSLCGNTNLDAGEACDDGVANADTAACTTECALAICGDGHTRLDIIDTADAAYESCDDGNMVNQDPCRNDCRFNTCGDGVPGGPGEACDDGNVIETDACTSHCGPPSCGDGFVNSSEACDDGNDVDTDVCLSSCVAASCGDGFRRTDITDAEDVLYEECDNGASNADTAACKSDCSLNICGDSFVGPSETCDDGDTSGGDGCSATCQIEVDWCLIAGVFYETGDDNPANDCQECLADTDNVAWSNKNSGSGCNDGNACTVSDTCNGSGSCLPGTPRVCVDGITCTADSCDTATGCVYTNLSGTSCTDDLWCNGTDTCLAGACTAHQYANRCITLSPATPVCDEPHDACVQCLSSPDCGGATPVCNTATDTCVQCLSATDCGGATPICDTSTHTCVQCLSNTNCGGATPYCYTTTHSCVACLTDVNCSDSNACTGVEHCSSTTHTCEAGKPLSCAGDTPYCSTTLGCVECLANTHCNDDAFCNGLETCVAGTCHAGTPPCDPGCFCSASARSCTCY